MSTVEPQKPVTRMRPGTKEVLAPTVPGRILLCQLIEGGAVRCARPQDPFHSPVAENKSVGKVWSEQRINLAIVR